MNEPPKPPQTPSGNGAGAPPPRAPANKPAVSSRLAQRQNPVAVFLKDFLTGARRIAFRDPLALFLVLASIGLAVAFALLLGSIKPSSSGMEVPLSTVQKLAKRHDIASAILLDHDSRVELTTSASAPVVAADGALAAPVAGGTAVVQPAGGGLQQLWAAYPASGAVTQQLALELGADGASVTVEQQSGKSTRGIIVQFLIPILLLVCLFSLFMRVGGDSAAGGLAAFSEFTGKGRKKGKGTRDKITFADVAGAGEALAELREIRDYLAEPASICPSARRHRRGSCWSALPGPARRCSQRPSPAKRTPRSSRSRARTSSSRSSASAPPACATCSARRARHRRRSSSSTSSTPPGASVAPGSARATTSASRRSTRSSSRWTASPATAGSS